MLSNGEEDTKGTDLTRETHDQLQKGGLNYIGLCRRAGDIFSGDVDVVVCDGFTGNIVIKTTEGVAHNLTTLLRSELRRSIFSKLGYLLARKAFKNFRKRLDYREYGGALLLGVDKPVVFAHGSSNERAFMNALRVAHEYAERDIVASIRKDLEQNEEFFAFKKRRPLIDRILHPFSRKEEDGEDVPEEGAEKKVLQTEQQQPIHSSVEPESPEEAEEQNDELSDRTEK